tara:strand:+ start:653 stop:934 length:282 start_codon:yes stop_codon:yes gene_type:complete
MTKGKAPRWRRIDNITIAEQKRLDALCSITPGMNAYGNRVRTAVMLQLDTAEQIAKIVKDSDKSVSAICCLIIEQYFHPELQNIEFTDEVSDG